MYRKSTNRLCQFHLVFVKQLAAQHQASQTYRKGSAASPRVSHTGAVWLSSWAAHETERRTPQAGSASIARSKRPCPCPDKSSDSIVTMPLYVKTADTALSDLHEQQ
ncbi:hypothetical protein PC116_g8470 [Phytophthora cactorum]|uniref:Uncharacterized protein n=1 Tax=Phytophthora cactorum TaxID=29920 RepID=A0A8T1GII6_9STRA|nr:hypothetical protein PC111_g4610 [Phytophthora cactorum]KAG2862998.1 hypothetical protein PC113_g5810 [Phytophthora cactorum]KAG2920211.1 hypothetical protein PC114_g6172 [Phytophthora cactorum]KAG2934799.1 hypothetical protein PC115_g5067 [Phytophthora cactorum]KAG2948782.1 hypothetical protein PC117_g5759 [Phytophthora cactorum]